MERILTILENTPLAPGVFRLLLDGADADDVRAPGQFFNLSVDGFYLRRPISVCDAAGSRVTLIYKVVGAGTRALSDYRPGRTLRVLTALGNGYDLTETGSHPLLLGGGAGVQLLLPPGTEDHIPQHAPIAQGVHLPVVGIALVFQRRAERGTQRLHSSFVVLSLIFQRCNAGNELFVRRGGVVKALKRERQRLSVMGL